MKQLEDRVAIVTGGASGIGKAIVEIFVREGAKVVIADLDDKLGNELINNLGEGNVIFIRADTSSPDDSKRIVEAAIENFGALHIAVNNAGIAGESKPVDELSIPEWKKVIDINLNGVFYGLHYQLPEMIKNGGGSIINMASILGTVGFAQSSAYASAKHGVVGLTKSASWEYATKGIRINAIGPGFVSTPLIEDSLDQETLNYLKSQHAFQRLGKPEEVAELALWLASDKSSFVTGSYCPVDGGYLAK